MELYPRKCSITGKGFSEGFIVGDDYAIDQKSADELAVQSGYASYLEAHQEDEDFAYWTDWGDTDTEVQTEFYLKDGTVVFVTKESIVQEITERIKKEINVLQSHIDQRGFDNGFDTTLYDLYDSDVAEDGFDFWNQEDLDNHIYDLGNYFARKVVLADITEILKLHNIQH